MSTKPNADTSTLRDAIVRYFIEKGDDATVHEIAVFIGWTDAKVRRVLDNSFGVPPGIVMNKTSCHSTSGDNPGKQSGSRRVRTYGPSRETLRDVIVASRK